MTKRVPISRCKRCVRYNGYYCPLLDLDPCRFMPTKEAENEMAKTRFLAFVSLVAIGILALAFLGACKQNANRTQTETPTEWSAVGLLRQINANDLQTSLTDWQMLEMAIIYTESKFKPDAVGAAGDAGLFQMLPIYVAEVNRVAGTDYAHADAYDPATAVEMFNALQDFHNQAHDTERAIALHNRGAAYRAQVLENLELIRRYEAARTIIITH